METNRNKRGSMEVTWCIEGIRGLRRTPHVWLPVCAALLMYGALAPQVRAAAAAAVHSAQEVSAEPRAAASEIDGDPDVAATCLCKADVDKDGAVTANDATLILNCISNPTDPICDNADVNCDGFIDAGDIAAWECVFSGVPPAECCGKTQKFCIYDVACIDGACQNCPFSNAGGKCFAFQCIDTCTVSYTSTCGGAAGGCCLEMAWQGLCEIPPAGMPPCPTENQPCTCDPTEGGCCQADGTCIDGPESKCTGQYMGDGVFCRGVQPCCLGGVCVSMDALCCEKQGGVVKACTPGAACCITDADCPSEKCRPGFCDPATSACDLMPKQPGCCTSDLQCPNTKCRVGVCDAATNACSLGPKAPGCCESDAQCDAFATKCRQGLCDSATNTCFTGPKNAGCCETDAQCPGKCDSCDFVTNTCFKRADCCDSDFQCPDTKCRVGLCDFLTNTCFLSDKAPGCCETDVQCPGTKCRQGICDLNLNACTLGPKAPGCCESDAQCGKCERCDLVNNVCFRPVPDACCVSDVECPGKCDICDLLTNTCVKGIPGCCDSDAQCADFATKCRPGLCDFNLNECFTGAKAAGCCETDSQCANFATKCRPGLCDFATNTCFTGPKAPNCCESDAQCVNFGTKCRPGLCDPSTNTCFTGPKAPNCCETDAQCVDFGTKCRPGLCDPLTNTCFAGPKAPDCCDSDLQCPGKCDSCDLVTNTCFKLADCCDSDLQCPDTKCRVGLCDFLTNTCFLTDKAPGCCETDAQCPGTKCRPGVCDLTTNACTLGPKAPNCCASNAQCPGTKCRAGICNLATNTCTLGPKAPNCCTTSAQCPGTKCRVGICDPVTNLCTLSPKAPNCCETHAQCGSGAFCDFVTNTCVDEALFPKWSQRPGDNGEDVASNLDWPDFAPNVVVVDDWVSDGRVITAVRWWGSVLPEADPKACPVLNDTCGDPGLQCVCSTRIDGSLNCADSKSLGDCFNTCSSDADCVAPSKCFGDPGALGCCAVNCGETPPDPKVCEGKGTSCGDPTLDCVCETRIDNTLNCADNNDFTTGIHGFCPNGDIDCPTGTKCFTNTPPGVAPVCAHNCGDHPLDPKVCDPPGDSPFCNAAFEPCGAAGLSCHCGRYAPLGQSVGIAGVCMDSLQFANGCADMIDCAGAGDPFCDAVLPGSKCVFDECCNWVCGYNCGETPPDPKLCTGPEGSLCGGPLDCVCSMRIDGTLNCADSVSLANSTVLCQSDAQCVPPSKCFGQQGAQGVCAVNCGDTPPDPKLCSPAGADCGIAGVNCFCSPRIDSSLNCADIDDLALCNFPCASDTDCDTANGVKCFQDPAGVNPGCCTRNCSGFQNANTGGETAAGVTAVPRTPSVDVGDANSPQLAIQPDGWFLSFHQPLRAGTPQDLPLAVYFCDYTVVQTTLTTLGACDGHPVLEHFARLDDCCLVHQRGDTRYDPPLPVAFKDGFHEQQCDDYHLDVQAVVGAKFFQDPLTLECIEQKTGRTADADFWGWHTTDKVCGKNQFGPNPALVGSVKMDANNNWAYGPWSDLVTTCSAPNMAFELLTPEPGASDFNGNCVPDKCECPPINPPKPPPAATHAGQSKNRYLSIVPNNPGKLTALRVTLTASTTFPNAVGKQWWVGRPQEVCENSGQGLAVPPSNCGPAPGIPKRTMWSSKLDCNQQCVDWHSLVDAAGNLLDVLHIGGADVATGSVYEIQAVDCACDKADPNNFSSPLPVSTAKWGDTVGLSIAACPNSAPNGGPISLILDCVSIVNKFSNLPCAPLKSRVDIDPSDKNRLIDFSDVVQCVGAFTGGGFPYPGPVGCP